MSSPIVKDLTPHNVPPYSPTAFIILVPKPIMAQNLSVEIMGLEGAVVDMTDWPFEEEKAMVVDKLGALIQAVESCDVHILFVVDKLDSLA